jgi:hypothetical protein
VQSLREAGVSILAPISREFRLSLYDCQRSDARSIDRFSPALPGRIMSGLESGARIF